MEECFLFGMPRPEVIVENGESLKEKYLPDSSYLLWHEGTSNQKSAYSTKSQERIDMT